MFNHAVSTAVEYNIPVVWIVWNNLGYVSIRDQQFGFFGRGRELATRFRRESTGELLGPDYAAMARAMGAKGILVERPGDLREQVVAALECGQPCVVDVRVDADVAPPATGSWDLPPLPAPPPNFGWES